MGFPIFPYTNFHDMNTDWILKTVKEMVQKVNEFAETLEPIPGEIEQLQTDLANLEKTLQDVIDGKYVANLIPALSEWIDNNLQQLLQRMVKYVFFGISQDGYFCAYIPKSWQFITFDTVMDSTSPLYGHLILKW